jgi:hypothetical protein
VSFFEQPPPPPDAAEREPPTPEWLDPPENVLGAAVPVRLLLARTSDVALAVQHFTAYPVGMEFEFVVARRHAPEDRFDHPIRAFPRYARRWPGSELPDDLLRFGVQLADGSKASNLPGKQAPGGPALIEQSGGGGRIWRLGYWLWPLPPPGLLAFVVEWPAEGISETRVETDAEPFRRAAAEAETLWLEEPGTGTRFVSHRGVLRATGSADEEE